MTFDVIFKSELVFVSFLTELVHECSILSGELLGHIFLDGTHLMLWFCDRD